MSELLRAEGYRATLAKSLKDARSHRDESWNLVLLDIGLPDGSGFDFCRELHDEDPHLPVLFLTARSDEESAVRGLSLGAVDYVRKPVAKRELVMRIPRTLKAAPEVVELGELKVLVREARVTWKENAIALTPRELELLTILAQNQSRLVTREKLLQQMDTQGDLDDKSINTYVRRLKTKLAEAGVSHVQITAVYGSGYRLEKK